MVEIKAFGFSVRQPNHRRKRACFFRHLACGRRYVVSKQTRCQRSRVAVEDNFVCSQPLASCKFDSRRGFVPNCNARHGLAILKRHALFLGELFKRTSQRAHPALDCPHSLCFDMCNKHQCGRCLEWRRSAIGRVAPEQLPQPWVSEILPKRRP